MKVEQVEVQNIDQDENKQDIEHVTYGEIETIDRIVYYEVLKDIEDQNQPLGNRGILSEGNNGLKRQEVRDVFINGIFNHQEIVKDTYDVRFVQHEQSRIGTKVNNVKSKAAINESFTDEITRFVNVQHEQYGLSAVVKSTGIIQEVSNIRAHEIISSFSHTSVSNNVGNYFEALYRCSNESSQERIVEAWMKSPAHREVLLNTDSKAQSVGLFIDDSGSIFVVLLKQPTCI